MTIINFVFIRHGESCQNLVYRKIVDIEQKRKLMARFYDPTLSDAGKTNSINAGIKLKVHLDKGVFPDNMSGELNKIDVSDFDVIGSSPMIRAMETSYYMTCSTYPLNKIYVFPYLREISTKNNTRVYLDEKMPMKTLSEQQYYLKSENILDSFEFKYVQGDNRYEPGDISNFVEWFTNNFELPEKPLIKVMVFLHSNVMYEIVGQSTRNNMGFVMSMHYNKKYKDYHLLDILRIEYNYDEVELRCPTKRCPGVCDAL